MTKGQLLFSVVFGSRKAVRAIFSEFDEINAQNLIFPGTFQKVRGDQRGALGAPHVVAARPRRGARRPSVRRPRGPSDSVSSPI